MKSIDEDIKNGTWKPIYLLYGEERYLRNFYSNKLKTAIGAADMNFTVFSGNIDVREVIDLAETLPFFAEKRLIVLEDSNFAKESNDQFADYIPQIPQSTVILMVESEVDKRNRVYKAAAANGRAVDFEKQNENTLTSWILSRVKKEGKQITTGAVQMLFERCGDDMTCLDSELEKLFSYTLERDAITGEDVEAICVKQTEANIFEMIRFVSLGKRKEALGLYYEMLSAKEPPMRILYLLAKQFNQLLQVKLLTEDGNSAKIIGEKIHLKDYIVKKLQDQGRRFSKDALFEALEECTELEEAVKTGKLADSMSVELVILKYASDRA